MASDPLVRIRTYRQGLGDCHLITILPDGEPAFRMLIDCGVYQTAKGGAEKIRQIVADVIEESGGYVDILTVTHEHWDHVSGFNQAQSSFLTVDEAPAPGKLKAGEVWMGWAEDPKDPVAQRIDAERGHAIRRVALSGILAQKFAAAGDAAAGRLVAGLDGILGFFGGAGRTTRTAMAHARSMSDAPRYCRPSDPPRRLTKGVLSYVLGPPLDPACFYRLEDEKETYGIVETRTARALAGAIDAIGGDASEDHAQPFDPRHRLKAPFLGPGAPTPHETDFFEYAYWGKDTDGGDQQWRRIDGDWLAGSREFALKLDNATNNTSLVLALELEASGRTLLFVADAQVGSWLSWMDLAWEHGDRRVTGPELVAKAVFLKVGHHGSHNATLRARGLETMSPDLVAFIPTDEELAKKVGWGRMPLPGLIQALDSRAGGRVVRTDREFSARADASDEIRAFEGKLTRTELYYELEID
jgi:hypothetical protein